MSMTSDAAFAVLENGAILAGMRGAFVPDVALAVAETLMDEGINAFELTLNSEQPIEAMKVVKARYGDQAAVGMGTVLSVEDAAKVIDAGADFVMSPVFQPDVVQYVLEREVLMVPGVATPTEAMAAWEMGCKLLKVFPIGALGLDYFKAMFGPLDFMKFGCHGNMNAENGREFILHGATYLGMGGWLTGDGTWNTSKLRSRAHVLKNAVASARGDYPVQEA